TGAGGTGLLGTGGVIGSAGVTGSGGAAGVAGTAGATGSGGTVTGVGGVGTGVGGTSPVGSAGTGGGAGTGGPGPCGGSAHTMCPSGQFCELAIGACATVDPSGICMVKPTTCDSTIDPVCGCDGKSYANACERQAAGISEWSVGICSAPTCPAVAPQSQAACTEGNIDCVYAITTGSNAGCVERFSCMAGTWSAPVVVCPG
ncbi:MAG TPA: Kazal-type serine protease inhibitor domain-containing protein, partial [Polyangia bacterium]|nr:Kazal-type serine protease inhibitor domain-containing protein [Polyangia bacterium]